MGKMTQVSVATRAEWLPEYLGRAPNKKLAFVTHNLMRLLYHPIVSFEPDAEAAIHALDPDTPAILVGNHTSNHDANAVAATIERRPNLRRKFRGKTNPMGKIALLNTQGVRYFYREMGTFPGIREQDTQSNNPDGAEPTTEEVEARREASRFSIMIGIDHIARGLRSLLIFPEGTRNKDRIGEILDIKGGVSRIAMGAAEKGVKPPIIPFVNYYDTGGKPLRWWQLYKGLRPYQHWGMPIEKYNSEDQVKMLVHSRLKTCLESAKQEAGKKHMISSQDSHR